MTTVLPPDQSRSRGVSRSTDGDEGAAESNDKPKSASKHVPALDGMRGFAVLLVLIFHFMVIEGHSPGVRLLQKTWGLGWCGVDLFFVLSGFLITGILYDAKNSPHFFRNFYARRTVRIFPLYYAFLVAFLLVLPAVLPGFTALFGTPPCGQWPYWTYSYNLFQGHHDPETFSHVLGVTWSLAIEEQFYLVWPTVVFFCGRRTLLRICAALIGLSLICRIALVLFGDRIPLWGDIQVNNAVTQWSFCRMDVLATGAALALMFRSGRPQPAWLNPAAWIAVLIVPVIILGINLIGGSLITNRGFLSVGYTLLALMFGAMLLLTITGASGSLAYFFNIPLLRTFGRFSYAMYLFNQPVRFTMQRYVFDPNIELAVAGSRIPAQVIFFLMGTMITFGFAWLSWHLFEKHFLKLKEWFPMGSQVKWPPSEAKSGAGSELPASISA